MKKILVTGGAGFIGSNLVFELVNQGYDVTSIDDYSAGLKKNEVEGAKYINMDIDMVDNIYNDFDLCFHLAAMSRVQPSFRDPTKYFRVNVNGTMKIMEWAKKNKVKVVYAGSSSRHHDPSDSPYAMYKFLGEEVCKLYKNSYSVDVEIARFYNVYGPNESLDEIHGNVIGIWQTKVKKGLPLPVVGDGNQRRDFTHVLDIVDGLIKIALSNKVHEDAWELGTGINYSVNELYEMFNNKFKCNRINIPDQKGNYKLTLRENDDLINQLGWSPKDRLKQHIDNL
ncbi:MAG: NAD-dependent epimerase/dehydratase family protein [Flavobacteriaceae bacterium]|nr:NAD-dependent epimerase/dehydratase family protein [Flavobacteriaceae bacterium]